MTVLTITLPDNSTRQFEKWVLRSGFTLIELSIVLVIIGLLVGGVLVGKDMIKSAEIRKTIAELDKVTVAVNTFKLKYSCLAGDCLNATQFFGAGAQPDQTTNGNGDGTIGRGISNGNFVVTERAYFFDHLANSKLLSTSTFNELTGSQEDFVAGVEFPKTPVGKGFVVINSSYNAGYSVTDWTTIVGHAFLLGVTMSEDGAATNPGLVTAPDAFGIDSKMDDGFPRTGIVQALAPTNADLDTVLGFFPTPDSPGSGSCVSHNDDNPYSSVVGDTCALSIKAAF